MDNKPARQAHFNDLVLQKLKAGATLFGCVRPLSPPLNFEKLPQMVEEATQRLGMNPAEQKRMATFVSGVLGTIKDLAREEQVRELIQVTQSGLKTVPGQELRSQPPAQKKSP